MSAAMKLIGIIVIALGGSAVAAPAPCFPDGEAPKQLTAGDGPARSRRRAGDRPRVGQGTLIVSESDGASPDGTSFLATKTGGRIAAVGGKGFATATSFAVQVSGASWAFVDSRGDTVVIEDVTTGKISRTIATGVTGEVPGQLAFGGSASKLAIVFGAGKTGTTVVIDVATGKPKTLTAPVCQ